MERTYIKAWYLEEYPTDNLGKELHQGTTFEGLFMDMDNYLDVYKTIGVADSLVRERVFTKLAEIMDVTYDYVYNQWLLTNNENDN